MAILTTTLFSTVGTAGAPLRDTEPYNGNNGPYTPINIEHSKSYGYTIVEVNGNTVTMTYKKRIAANNFQSFHVMSYSVGSDIGFSGQTTIELEKHEAGQIQVDVYSQIDQTLNWTITGQGGCSWITNVSPSAGTSTGPDDKTTVTIDIDAAGLAPGDYTCELLLEADNGDIDIIPVALTVYDRVDLEEVALLAQYWMADCGDVDDCIAVDFCIDDTIDTLDLQQLALSWLGEEVMHIHIPISHWQLDEQSGTSAADSIGENDGTLIDFPTDDSQWVDGRVDGALSFDGIDDYISTPFVVNPAAGPFSAFMWIKGGSTYDKILTQTDDGTGLGNIWLQTNSSGYLVCLLNTDSSSNLVSTHNSHTDGNWHHVGIVWDGVRRYIYVDGAVVASDGSDLTGNLESCTGSMHIGVDKNLTQNCFWAGLIDEVTIYGEALSQAEILWLYMDGLKPISHWQFDEQTGNSAADSVGENHGTLIDFPTDDSQWTGGALSFDGIDDYVVATGYKGILGTSSRTCTAWIKTSNDGAIVFWGTGSAGGNWLLLLNDITGSGSIGALRVSVGNGRIVGTTDLRDGLWHHVAAVLVDDGSPDVSEVKLYVDGTAESITYIDAQPIDTVSGIDLWIGTNGGVIFQFAGLIDEVAIYDEALSQAEILWLYTNNQ